MTTDETIRILRQFNAWRRDDAGEIDQPNPREIGEAIDRLCDEMEQVKKALADPLAVHLNMLRGTIAWTPANLRHLLGDDH